MEKLPSALQHVYTIVLVMFGWVLFFSPSLGSAVSYMGTMLGIGGAGLADLTGWYYLNVRSGTRHHRGSRKYTGCLSEIFKMGAFEKSI